MTLCQMHCLHKFRDKVKTCLAKLNKPKGVGAHTGQTSQMKLRSQDAKASGTSFHHDLTEPPKNMPLDNIPPKRDKKMLDDVQDSDEEMEDHDEESDQDEGSLYAPTELTSECCDEEFVKDEDLMEVKGEDLMELPPVESCRFLRLLPRELRDKIYGYVLRLDAPMSEHKSSFRCVCCPLLMNTARKPAWESQISESRNILRTCHQIRNEGRQVFFDVNSWSLRRARLRQSSGHSNTTILDESQRMFDRLGQIPTMKLFKHVNMQINLSPLAYCDFTIPDSLALDDPQAIHLFELSQDPAFLAFHKLDEMAQCELFRAAFKKLVANRATVFPGLRTITLEVSVHEKNKIPDTPKNPLNRCGITFYIRIKLESQNHLSPTSLDDVSLPIPAPKDVITNASPLQRARHALHSPSIHPSIKSNSWIPSQLDPKRYMLSPLRELPGVQYIEVERRWTVRYRQNVTKDEVEDIRVQSLRRLWRFCSVCEMLEKAGPGFGEFLDPGLQYLNTSPNDVLEIIEHTTDEIRNIKGGFIQFHVIGIHHAD